MPERTPTSLDRQTLIQFTSVLEELSQLIDEENAILGALNETLPQALVKKKEELGARYAKLTVALRPRAAALQASGDLDAVALEVGIRGLVRRLKDNQSLLNGRKAATAQRVESVMTALSERERTEGATYGANGDTLTRSTGAGNGLHLSA
jgi:hypothetical protein